MIWTKDLTNFDWWEVELTFRYLYYYTSDTDPENWHFLVLTRS